MNSLKKQAKREYRRTLRQYAAQHLAQFNFTGAKLRFLARTFADGVAKVAKQSNLRAA